MRESYGDLAIAWVQLQRVGELCTVEAKICPEHKVRSKDYSVRVVVNEKEESVLTAECLTASLGGCKHAVALLAWIHRKSENPSCTSTECFWKKPILSTVGASIKYKEINEIVEKKTNFDPQKIKIDNNFLQLILKHPKAQNCDSHIINFYSTQPSQKLSMHYLSIAYKGDKSNVRMFNQFCGESLTSENCILIEKQTCQQSANYLWFELRYGRVTASIIFEAVYCKTEDGSLVEKVLSNKNMDSMAIKRGRRLENEVLSEVEKKVSKLYGECKIKTCGLFLNKQYPMLRASPDGISKNAIFEIKCPATEKTVSNYCVGKKLLENIKPNCIYRCFLQVRALVIFVSQQLILKKPEMEILYVKH